MKPPSPSLNRPALRKSRILLVAAVALVALVAAKGRFQLKKQAQHAAQPSPATGDQDSSGGSGGDSDDDGGGWAGSFLHKEADPLLNDLLDRSSRQSPIARCTADVHFTKLAAGQLSQLNSAIEKAVLSNQTMQPPGVAFAAQRMPCQAGSPGALKGKCCAQPVHFRLGSTDFSVFQQVFQYHYMRYLYTLFADKPPQYILDAGANAGFASLLFKLVWPNATVVSLEPDASNFAMLQANTRGFRGVHALNAGLWGHKANITVKTTKHGNWGRVFREAEPGEAGMPAYAVGDVAAMLDIPAFDFVKIDIEGAEGMVFEPGADFGWIKKARAVSLEIHDYFADYFGLGPSSEQTVSKRIAAAFAGSGYRSASDNEHVLFIQPEHLDSLLASPAMAGAKKAAEAVAAARALVKAAADKVAAKGRL